MKRILLISSLIIVSCSATMAQTQASTSGYTTVTSRPAATLTKGDFVAKVGEMTTTLNTNNTDAAKAKWTEMHQMLLTELGMTKRNIAGNEGTKEHYMDVIKQQTSIYSAMIKLKDDIIANKVAMIMNLNKFAATIE